MKFLIILSCIAFCKASQIKGFVNIETQPEPISPYSFGYAVDAADGSSTRQESSDGSGAVRGSYSLVTAEGTKRIVNYIADENGFRAQVQTNEPGTESKNPADAIIQSSQLPAEEIALKYGPRPVVQSQVVQTLGIKGVEQKLVSPLLTPKAVVLTRPLVGQALIQQKVFTGIPLQKKLEIVPEERQILSTIPNLQLVSKQIETPVRLLSKIPRLQTLKSFDLDLQQKEELVPQTYEQF